MNEGELDVLVSQYFDPFIDGIRRAWNEVGKKGAAQPRQIITYVDRALAVLGKLRREYPVPAEVVVEANDLDRKLDEIAAKMRSEGKTPTTEAIIKQVYASPAVLALVTKQSGAVFEERTIRDSASHASDRSKEKKTPDERNYTFEFYHHPKLKTVPRTLDYIDPDTLQWVHPSSAKGLRRDWQQAIAQCSKNEQAMNVANDYLETLRKKHKCDVPGPELLRLEAEAKKRA